MKPNECPQDCKFKHMNHAHYGLNTEKLQKVFAKFDLKDKGQKLDQEKLMWNLIPWHELEEVVAVLTFGAKKYAPENWKKVQDGEARYRAAALRHLAEIGKGIQKDSETNFSHYSHAICSLLFASWFARNHEPGRIKTSCRNGKKIK